MWVAATLSSDLKARSEFKKAKELEAAGKYQAAIIKYETRVMNYAGTQYADSARSSLEKLTSFEFIARIVMDRMNKGASPEVALGEFTGLKVKWRAIVGSICWGLSSYNPPVVFKIGKLEFYGIPSYGLDRLKFLVFCERNEGKLVTVEGTLISASDWPGTPLVVEVNALSLE